MTLGCRGHPPPGESLRLHSRHGPMPTCESSPAAAFPNKSAFESSIPPIHHIIHYKPCTKSHTQLGGLTRPTALSKKHKVTALSYERKFGRFFYFREGSRSRKDQAGNYAIIPMDDASLPVSCLELGGYFQRSIACRCADSGGSSASSMRTPFKSVMFDRMAFVGLARVSLTFAPRRLNIAVAAAMFSTCTPK